MRHSQSLSLTVHARDHTLPNWFPNAGESVVLPTVNTFADVDPTDASDTICQLDGSPAYYRKGGTNHYNGSGASRGNAHVIDAQSGGAFCPWLGRWGAIILHGGGHNDSAENSVYAFLIYEAEFVRLSNPSNQSLIGIPQERTPGDPNSRYTIKDPVYCEFEDGQPGSCHSMNYLVMIPPEMGGGPKGSLLRPIGQAIGMESIFSRWSHVFALDQTPPGRWARYSVNAYTGHLAPFAATCVDTQRRGCWISQYGGYTLAFLNFDRKEWLPAWPLSWSIPLSIDTMSMRYLSDLDRVIAIGRPIMGRDSTGKNIYGPMAVFTIDPGVVSASSSKTYVKPERVALSMDIPSAYSMTMAVAKGRMYFISAADINACYVATPKLTGMWPVERIPFAGPGLEGMKLGVAKELVKADRWIYVPAADVFILWASARSPVVAWRPPGAGPSIFATITEKITSLWKM